MKGNKKGIRSIFRRMALSSASNSAQVDPTGSAERKLHSTLIASAAKKPKKLQSLSWAARERNDLVLALGARHALATKIRDKSSPSLVRNYTKMAALETRMRHQLAVYAPEICPVFDNGPRTTLPKAKPSGQSKPGPRLLQKNAAANERFWDQHSRLPKQQAVSLCTGYTAFAAASIRSGQGEDALTALQPIMEFWPHYQTSYLTYYRAVLSTLLSELKDNPDDRNASTWTDFDNWWAFFLDRREIFTEACLSQIWKRTLQTARKLQHLDLMESAERIVQPAFEHWDDNSEALPIIARISESREDWRAAAQCWQLYASIVNPVSTKSGTIVAQNTEERTRQANYARTSLRKVRAKLALAAYAGGRKREFRELVTRIVESLPDQRLLKFDTTVLDVARLYIQDGLREDQAFAAPTPIEQGALRRVVLALDILKISDVHTHSRVIFTMCRNLLRHDPNLEVHVVITNERFAVTTPVVSPSFHPKRVDALIERARAALGDLFGNRFQLHNLHEPNLEGVVTAAKHILNLRPDLVLYGGGHRGMFSNESRLVRHALFDLVPAAFLYIQSNNEVDPKFDMIIARGPHEIPGDSGEAVIRVQPYPTIVEEVLDQAQQKIDPQKAASKTIVSAITGVRLDVRLSNMDSTEMDHFFSVLDRVPGSVWHFIGCTDTKAVEKANPEIARRVKAKQLQLHTVMPFENFTSLVGNAALFLHLPGFTGGSGGAAVARRNAIPILTFNHSDVSGRQPHETVFETDNTEGFADMAVALLQDNVRWTEIAQRQIEHTNWIRDTSVQGFHACLVETVEIGQARIGLRS